MENMWSKMQFIITVILNGAKQSEACPTTGGNLTYA